MRNAHPRFAALLVLSLLSTLVACLAPPPPPPIVKVTSPERGTVQRDGRTVVKGTALPGPNGGRVSKVTVNGTPAMLAADGSFTATVDVPAGATLLETVAFTEDGAKATDARVMQVGELRPVGSNIERAITAALPADVFAKLAAAAGPLIKTEAASTLIAPMQFGDEIANAKLSISKFTVGDAKVTMTPVDGGLQLSVQISTLDVVGTAAYDGLLVPTGSSAVKITADTITLTGTLVVTPAGTAGVTTTIASPSVRTTNLKLQSSGLVGDILDLLNSELVSTIEELASESAGSALEPLINEAMGMIAGPQQLEVLGRKLEVVASPSAIAFTRAGAQVTMNLQLEVEGSEASKGFLFTPNTTPSLNMTNGVQLGLADDLVNELLADTHALGLLDVHLREQLGPFDAADLKLTLPPMISASNSDGSLRLVLGDMVATFSNQDQSIVKAAINAQVDLQVERGTNAQEIALDVGNVHVFVNLLDDPANPTEVADLPGATDVGIGLKLDSLNQFLFSVPLPSVAGVSIDNLAARADSGYLVASGQLH